MKKLIQNIIRIFLLLLLLGLLLITGYKTHETLRINKILKAHDTEFVSNITNAEHIQTAVQQIMIGSLCNNYDNALQTLQNIKAAGYDAIELNDFMIHKSSPLVKLMTQFSGMPIGNGGNLDWHKLIKESSLEVISLHSNLSSIEYDVKAVADEAKSFGTNTVVITGMYRFDYSNLEEVRKLAQRLNAAGKALSNEGIQLLYHNHNCELQKVTPEKTAYDIIIEETNPEYINFEFDSYWIADGGANVYALMEKLGDRIKLWHINDRGYTKPGPYITPILTEDATELGSGNIDLDTLTSIALANGIEGIILETHKNWIDNDPLKSIQVSADYLRNILSLK